MVGGRRQCTVLLEESVLMYQPASDAEQANQVETLTHDGTTCFFSASEFHL